MKANRNEIKSLKDAFLATVTDEQKQLIKERRKKMKNRKLQLKERRENIKERKKKKIG